MKPSREKIQVDDPVFGLITYDDEDMWIHETEDPDGGDFAIGIIAPESGPSDTQRAFFRGIFTTLALSRKAMAYLEREEQSEIRYLSLVFVSIENDEECRRGNVILNFYDRKANQKYPVYFENFEPVR